MATFYIHRVGFVRAWTPGEVKACSRFANPLDLLGLGSAPKYWVHTFNQRPDLSGSALHARLGRACAPAAPRRDSTRARPTRRRPARAAPRPPPRPLRPGPGAAASFALLLSGGVLALALRRCLPSADGVPLLSLCHAARKVSARSLASGDIALSSESFGRGSGFGPSRGVAPADENGDASSLL
mmetsp:Transcript_43598/g.145263  ORF Transcript_43598/g.145263 Transcript_43598/m.145263 type:complete len:184 (-) Transcript_43598:167-718(-)